MDQPPRRIPADQIRIKVQGHAREYVASSGAADDSPVAITPRVKRYVETVDQYGNKYTGLVVWDGDILFQLELSENLHVVLAKGHVRYIKDIEPPAPKTKKK